MTHQLLNTGGPEDGYQNTTDLLGQVGRLMQDTTEVGDDQTVYKWGRSGAGEGLVATVPKDRGRPF